MSGFLLIVAAVATFNLNCSGNMNRIDGTSQPDEPFSSTLRVDLDAKKWCEGQCKFLRDLSDVQPAEIVFVDEDNRDPILGRRTYKKTVNRESGAYSSVLTSQLSVTRYTGVCEKADFTGFPTIETKF